MLLKKDFDELELLDDVRKKKSEILNNQIMESLESIPLSQEAISNNNLNSSELRQSKVIDVCEKLLKMNVRDFCNLTDEKPE